MKPTPIKSFFILVMLMAFTFSNLSLPVVHAAGNNQSTSSIGISDPTDAAKTSPIGLLNEDGTLNLDGSFSGSLDLEGWDVQMDPNRGPLFAPAGQWSNVGNGLAGALNGDIYAVAMSGTDIYVGGAFTNAGNNAAADYIAKWDGSNWSALGSNGSGNGSLNDDVNVITVSGSNIYVGGAFDNVNNNGSTLSAADYVAMWNGTNWSALGATAALTNDVNAIAISGSNVYVGGQFTNAGGISAADRIALWNGTTWSALSSLSDDVNAIAISGSNVYVGGAFQNAGGIAAADRIAMWNGTTWSALSSLSADVNAIAISGSNVYVGGAFQNAGGIATADRIALWNGSAWSALGSNGSGDGSINSMGATVTAIAISGSNVYVGGNFSNVSNNGATLNEADDVAMWNGTNWSALGSNGASNGSLGFGVQVNAIAADGSNVYVGGDFTDVNNSGTALGAADYITQWNGSAWSNLGSLNDGSISDQINAIAISGTDVYVGGQFTDLNNNGIVLGAADYIAKWDGSAWSALGSDGAGDGSLNNDVNAIAISGTNVYVGGQFDNVNNNGTTLNAADRIAMWNGTNWSALSSLSDDVNAIAVSGSNVYVGGDFQNAGGIAVADRIALWNGTTWSALGSSGLNNTVNAIAINGSNVYVGGQFDNVAGINAADFIALWNGSAWSALGATPLNNDVNAIAISGSNVYVGGQFINAGGIATADYIALWNGSSWSALGSNGAGSGSLNDDVNAIAVSGSNVYVGGAFFNVNNNGTSLGAADRIAMWNGSAWSALGSNGAGNGSLNDDVNAIAIDATDAYVGGSFTNVNNNGTALNTADYIAAYGLPDLVAPSTTSFTLQTPAASPTNADTLVFRATFNEAVTGVDIADFAVNGTTTATVTGVNPVSASVYDVTISGGDLASFNGVVGLNFSGVVSITDLASNPLPNTEPGIDQTYTLDNTAPSTTSFNRQTPATSPTNADTLVFRATFSEDVTGVNLADFAVNGTTTATVTSISPVSASVYDVTVSGGDLASFNGVVGLDFSATPSISDLVGNSLPNTEPGTDQTYTLDNAAPSASSFTLQTPATSPTNADTLVFRATFSEDVTGVDIADFAVNGTTTATVTGVSPVSASVYDVTVSGGDLASFNGVVGLDFSGAVSITDLISNSLPNTEPTTDQTYTLDNAAPSTSSFTLQTPASSPTNADTLVFRATFNEAVTGVDLADFAVNGTTTATVTGISPVSASVYDVTVSGGDLASFNGVVGLDFSASPSITDLVGNSLPNTEPGTDQTYTLDNSAPSTISFTLQTPAASLTNADTLVFRATFSEDVTGVDVADFAVNGTTTATVTGVSSVSASAYDVTVSGGDLASFNGVVGLDFSASPSITDLVGNSLPNTEPTTDQTYTLENNNPSTTSFTRQTPATSPTNADNLVFRATFSEDVTGVDVADFAVNGTTTATVTGVSPVSASVYDVTISGGDLASFNGVVGLDFSASPSITDLVGNSLPNTEPGTDQTYTLDNTAPGVTINQASGQADPTNASPINFTVIFNEAVNPATFTDTDVTLGGSANPTTASVTQIAPMDGTTFNVAVSGMNTAGTVIASIQLGLVSDLAGNNNSASLSSDNTVNYVNPSPPVITEGASVNVTMSENGSPIPFALSLNATDPNGDPLTWSILSQATNGVAGVVAGPASSTSVSYTPALNFFGSDSFMVQVTDGALTDTITVNVTVTAVQTLAPVVLSSLRADANPTSAIHVNFVVTFSVPVTGVDMSDFAVTMTGVAGADVIAVNGSGSVYTVTVNTGSNVGTIRLDVLDDNSIVDAFSTPLEGGFTSGEAYTIVGKTPIFADVPFSHWANSYIERLYNAGITGGCGTNPLIYCPSTKVTRAEMAVFILKTIHGPAYVPPSATGTVFYDVPTTHWAAAWIEQFYVEGLTAGCGNGNYCPEQVLTTRAQMAVFLLRARYGSSYQPPAASGTVFSDVPADYWAAAWIEQLAVEGITTGCGGGNYCPEASLTRAEMAIFLVKTLYIPKNPDAVMPVEQ